MNASLDGWTDSKGRKPGCLPRASKPGEWCPLASERIKVIPEREWDEILSDPAHMRLRPSVPVVLNQGSVGSCAAESTTGGVMALRSFNGQKFELLNPWFIYRVTSGGRDNGSNIDTNLKFVREHGIAPERLHPRSKGWRARPSDEATEAAKAFKILEFFDIQNKVEFGSALIAGFPVVYGRRGHSILGVDPISRSEFGWLNSWGGDWGDGGFEVESYRGVNFSYGVFAIRVATDTRSGIVRASELPPMFEPYPIIQE